MRPRVDFIWIVFKFYLPEEPGDNLWKFDEIDVGNDRY